MELTSPVLRRVLDTALRYRYAILVVWAGVLCVRSIDHGHGDWDDFVAASRALFGEHALGFFGDGGLHIYASNPDIVTGPLTLVLTRMISSLGPSDGFGAQVLISAALGVAALFTLERTAARVGVERRGTFLLGGIVVLLGWNDLGGYGHLDDAIAVLAIVGACWAITSERALLLGVLLGVAVAAKQWGVIFLPLIVFAPSSRRLRAAAGAAVVVGVAWLPFVIAAPETLSQRSLTQDVAPDSVLAALGYTSRVSPDWIRPAQLAAGLIVVGIAVYRRRWEAALLVGVAARIVLDPRTFSYYTAAMLVGALMWDLVATRRAIPLWTIATFLALSEATLLPIGDTGRGFLRLAVCLAAIIVPLTARLEPRPERQPSVLATE